LAIRGRSSIWLVALAFGYGLGFLARLPERANQFDFSHYYVSALAMRQGIDPYTTDLTPLAKSRGLEIEEINHATYPPTFVLCFEPLTWLAPIPAYRLWIAMNILFLGIALYLLLDGVPKGELQLSLVGLAILYAPITDNFYYAQTQILILLLLTLFMRWLESGRHALAGSMLALAGLFKVFPLILLGYLLARRRWKAILYTGLFLMVGGLLTLGLVGAETSINFVRIVPFLTSRFYLARPANVALGAIVSRLFWYSDLVRMGLPPVFAGAVHLTSGLEFARRASVPLAELFVLALTVRATLGSAKPSNNRDAPVFALWVVTAILLSPTAWFHYLALLFIPFVVLVRQSLGGEASMRATRLGVASYLVAEFLMPIYFVRSPVPIWATWALANGPSLCLLLAYGSAYSLARTTPPGAAAEGRAEGNERCSVVSR